MAFEIAENHDVDIRAMPYSMYGSGSKREGIKFYLFDAYGREHCIYSTGVHDNIDELKTAIHQQCARIVLEAL